MKVPTGGWAKTGDELKQVWPLSDIVLISNQSELEAFRNRVNAGETSLNALVIANFSLTNTWTPISFSSNYAYIGTFDGGGHTITKLMTIDGSSYYRGLFGYIDSGGTVKNVKLADASIIGRQYVGAIVGYNNGGMVTDCTASGTVSGYSYTGGIVGCNYYGTVSGNTNTATVTISSTSYVGGIIGSNSGIVSANINSGSVTGTYAGGIAGNNELDGMVTGCTNSGIVTSTGTNDRAGGIVGINSGTVTNNNNSGNVSGTYAGSIIGYQGSYGTVSNNTNTGTVTGDTTYAI